MIRTVSGREMIVGRLPLRGLSRNAARVTLDIGCQAHDLGEVWASLTVAEARQLAGRLLTQATAIEHESAETASPASAPPASASPGSRSGSAYEGRRDDRGQAKDRPTRINVVHVADEAYSIRLRGHEVLVDQPMQHGGGDAAPTPTELFVASLASCVAFYAGRYLTRHGVSREGLRVDAEFEMATDRPARVAAVRMHVTVPAELPERRRAGLLAVASHCTVHNTLQHPPEVTIEIA